VFHEAPQIFGRLDSLIYRVLLKLLSIWKKRINSDFFQDSGCVSIFTLLPRLFGMEGGEQVIVEPNSSLCASLSQNFAQ
jgi:hypothetical protein